jgi:calcineurin-like phosphoesterase family protein
MSNIYFTSDTHYGHTNIASKNSSKWKEGFRHYKSLEEMNYDLVKGINKTVLPGDTLYHLGDWSFGGIENIWKLRKQIACKDIHLILGNHDHHIEENKVLPNVFQNQGQIAEGSPSNPFEFVTAKNLFSSIQYYKEIKINGKMFVLSHYAHRVWYGSHKGYYHLYGHSHDSLDIQKGTNKLIEYGKSMDCGVDSAIRILKEARPFSLEEITRILDKRSVEFPDHHKPRTNT